VERVEEEGKESHFFLRARKIAEARERAQKR
jgi:hypothetical protein